MARVFPLESWASSSQSRIQADLTTTHAPYPFFGSGHRDSMTDFQRNLQRPLSSTNGSGLVTEGIENMSLTRSIQPSVEDGKREGGIRRLFRRASVSLKSKRQRRHSHAVAEERPGTSSAWMHKLKGRASFSRYSKSPPSFDTDGPVDSCEELMCPIPGSGTAPPIIPRGSGGAARATAAAQNELYGRHRQLFVEDLQGDSESGIGIALTTPEADQYIDTSISRVDFIFCLPAELAIQILAHLDALALSNASLVSTGWAQTCRSQHIWREAFLREKSKTYAMSRPIQPGAGLGVPAFKPENQWKDLYKIKQELEHNWRDGKAEAIYLNGHLDSIYCVQFDESKIITGSRDKTIRVWDMRTYTCSLIIGPPDVINDKLTMIGKDGQSIHYAMVGGEPTNRTAECFPKAVSFDLHHKQSILCLQYDEHILVTGSSDSSCIVYDIKNGYEPVRRLQHHSAAVLDLAFDDKYIVTCSKDVSICVWDRETGVMMKQLRGHSGPVNAVQMRGNTIVSCSGDFRVKLWNIDTGKNIREFSGHTKGLACSQFSEDSRFIASAGNDKIIRIWDANTGECLHKIEGHHDNLVRSLHIDSVSGRLISGSYDQDIKVFEMETGRLLIDFPKWHASWVLGAKSDYRRIISTGQDPKILIQDFGIYIKGIESLESN